MSADSFRKYLRLLEDEDALVSFAESVSWDLEASAVTTLANRTDGEIPIFESVEETTIDAALVGDPYRGPQCRPWEHLARAFELPPGLSGAAYYEAVIDRLRSPREPRIVDRNAAPARMSSTPGRMSTSCRFPGRTSTGATAGGTRTSTLSSDRTRRRGGATGRATE